MISPDGWLDWCERRPGPPWKVYETANLGMGIVWHSMEGWYEGSLRELDSPGRPASWMFSLKLDGTLVQHYDVFKSCWASGNGLANTHWWSVELEGLHSMPINAAQAATARRLMDEWAAWSGRSPSREGDLVTKTLWEHREVDTLAAPNAGNTACPSERYQPLWAALEDRMTEDDVRRIIREELAGAGLVGPGIPTLKRLDQWCTENAELVAARLVELESLAAAAVSGHAVVSAHPSGA